MHAEKKPFRILSQSGSGADRSVTYEADVWFGPVEADEQGYYETRRCTVTAASVRNTVSPNVSYWPQLSKALAL